MSDVMTHFAETYGAARAAFRAAASRCQTGVLVVPSTIDADLTIDWAVAAPEARTRNLVVVTSGVHGPEGFAGSAVQRLVLDLLRDGGVSRVDTGYLLVHGLNPFGFKYGRRVTEANVDLNRNFVDDVADFSVKRAAYAALSPLLNPEVPARRSWAGEAMFAAQAARVLRQHKLGVVTQAVAEGQYEFSRGIFFGGAAYEPQKAMLEALLEQVSAPYERIVVLDVHTGYGKKGKLHLLPGAVAPLTDAMMRAVFADHAVERTGQGEAFYAATGDMAPYLARLLTRRGKAATAMIAEYGTADSQGLAGSLRSLRRMIRENQERWHGAADAATTARIRREFRELFLPPEAAWRAAVLSQARDLVPKMVERLRAL